MLSTFEVRYDSYPGREEYMMSRWTKREQNSYRSSGKEDWSIVSASISKEALSSSTCTWCLVMYWRILAIGVILLSSAVEITALQCIQSFRLWASLIGWPKLHTMRKNITWLRTSMWNVTIEEFVSILCFGKPAQYTLMALVLGAGGLKKRRPTGDQEQSCA